MTFKRFNKEFRAHTREKHGIYTSIKRFFACEMNVVYNGNLQFLAFYYTVQFRWNNAGKKCSRCSGEHLISFILFLETPYVNRHTYFHLSSLGPSPLTPPHFRTAPRQISIPKIFAISAMEIVIRGFHRIRCHFLIISTHPKGKKVAEAVAAGLFVTHTY